MNLSILALAATALMTADWKGEGLASWQKERDIGEFRQTAEGLALSMTGDGKRSAGAAQVL